MPDVAKFGSVDVEKIVSLGADLVIAGGSGFNPPESIAKLRPLGVPVIVEFAPDVETALADMTLIGQATGTTDEAAAITASVQQAFDEVTAATATLPKSRVYYELDDTNGFFGPAPDYFGAEMITVAGGDPLTSGTDGVYQIEEEKILAFDPEVILLGDAAYGVTPDQVAARPGWDDAHAPSRTATSVRSTTSSSPGRARGWPTGSAPSRPRSTRTSCCRRRHRRPGRPRPSRPRPPRTDGRSTPDDHHPGPRGRPRARLRSACPAFGRAGPGGWSIVGVVSLVVAFVAGIALGSVDLAPVDDARHPRSTASGSTFR